MEPHYDWRSMLRHYKGAEQSLGDADALLNRGEAVLRPYLET